MSKWIEAQIHLQRLAKETTGDTERRGINGAQAMWMARDHYINVLEALKKAEEALYQANGCIRIDAMVDSKGLPFGTTTVALDAISDALEAIEDLGKE